MSPLPLFRFGSRARSTVIGIALCTMFIVASFSIVGGLKASMERLEANFESDSYLVTKPGDSGLSFFGSSEVTAIVPDSAYGSFVGVTVNTTEENVTIFTITDRPGHYFYGLVDVVGNDVYQTDGASYVENVTLTSSVESEQVHIAGTFSSHEFPDTWLLGSRELVDILCGQQGKSNFAIAYSLSDEQRAHLAADGFSVQSMTGAVDFLGLSMEQIQDDILLILIPSSFVIAVLSYGFVGSETADRRHDIGILKTIGAGRARILGYLFTNALVISLWGGILGLALGIVLSYALSTAVSTVFTSVFLMRIDLWLLALALLATVVAALAGGLVPSLRMTVSRPVHDLREAVR